MIDLAERTVPHVLRSGAHEHPDRPAIMDRETTLTYGGLLAGSLRVAGGLRALGVGAADTVVLMLDNSVDHALAWFGCSCLGAIEVPLNTAFMPAQIAYIVGHSEAEVIIAEEAYVDRLRMVADQLGGVRVLVVRGDPSVAAGLPLTVMSFDELVAGEPVQPQEVRPSDPLGILYTSGTTGASKGVVVTQAQTYGRMWPLGPGAARPGDRTLVVLPMYHVIAQCRGLYNTLIAGGTTVLEPRFSASSFWDVCRKHDITYVPLVGVLVGYLLNQPERSDDADHPVPHVALGTTSPALEQFRTRFGVREISVSYGLTEVGGVLVGPAEPVGCGYLRDDFEARLVDEDDREVAPGEVGELVLRPTEPWTVMSGYFKRPEETLRCWCNLWLHTGDLMRRREDGMYLFVGRQGERIRVRGENVSPGELEEHIGEHPAVAECAVVGVDSDADDGGVGEQEILAAVVPKESAAVDPAELVDFLAARVPDYAVPRYVCLLESLPRTESTRRVQRNVVAATAGSTAWDRRHPSPESTEGAR